MIVEIWKDDQGYRMNFQDSDFELTDIAYRKLIEAMTDMEEQPVRNGEGEGLYETIALDLEEK